MRKEPMAQEAAIRRDNYSLVQAQDLDVNL